MYAVEAINASSFPSKPVTIIVPYGVGGAADLMARVVAEQLSTKWEQPVIVDNRPGGSGVVGITHLVKSKNDGHILAAIPVSDLAVNPHIYKSRPFDVSRDLAPVVAVGAVPNVLVTPKTADIAPLLAQLRNSTTPHSYSSPGVGSQAHLASEFFNSVFNIQSAHIPFNSVPAALTALAGGHVDYMFAQWPSVQKLAQADKVKVVGLAADKRSEVAPGIPTIDELTGKSFRNFYSWSALMAPRGTAVGVREKIAHDVTEVLNDPKVIERFAELGAQAMGGTPDSLNDLIIKESAVYKKIVEDSKIKAE